MAKVFNGKEFMAQKSCTINLSNGVVATVSEVSDKTMKAMDELGKNEDSGINEIRTVVALMLGKKPEDLSDIGIVELRGAMDFLSESLFG